MSFTNIVGKIYATGDTVSVGDTCVLNGSNFNLLPDDLLGLIIAPGIDPETIVNGSLPSWYLWEVEDRNDTSIVFTCKQDHVATGSNYRLRYLASPLSSPRSIVGDLTDVPVVES